MSDKKSKSIPLKNIISEDGAQELVTSPDMQPYLRLIKAGMQDQDTTQHMEEIAAIPLEKQYVWRVASALKWAFADLETVSVNVDRETLSEADLKKLIELLRLRPIQFCIFLKALIGTEGMERLMKNGIETAKKSEDRGKDSDTASFQRLVCGCPLRHHAQNALSAFATAR